MSWLRLDDGFAEHPKLDELPEAQRWRWVALLCWCARQQKGGRVTATALKRAGVDGARLLELGLLERDAQGVLWVHDWAEYNGPVETAAKRQRRYRMRRAGVSEEEIERDVPRSDSAWLEGRQGHDDVTRDVTKDVTKDVIPRACNPTPTPTPTPSTQTAPRDEVGARANAAQVGRLLALLALNGTQADHVRGMALRSPAHEVEELTRAVGAGGIASPLELVLMWLSGVAA